MKSLSRTYLKCYKIFWLLFFIPALLLMVFNLGIYQYCCIYCLIAADHGEQLPAYLQRASCPICGKVLSSPGNVTLHIQNIHSEIPQDQWETCKICQKRWKTRHQLIGHMAKVHGIYQKKQSFALAWFLVRLLFC